MAQAPQQEPGHVWLVLPSPNGERAARVCRREDAAQRDLQRAIRSLTRFQDRLAAEHSRLLWQIDDLLVVPGADDCVGLAHEVHESRVFRVDCHLWRYEGGLDSALL